MSAVIRASPGIDAASSGGVTIIPNAS
jgi:hypothetical protein